MCAHWVIAIYFRWLRFKILTNTWLSLYSLLDLQGIKEPECYYNNLRIRQANITH